MSRPGNIPGLMIGSVRRMAVAGINTDEAKTNLPVAAGCGQRVAAYRNT